MSIEQSKQVKSEARERQTFNRAETLAEMVKLSVILDRKIRSTAHDSLKTLKLFPLHQSVLTDYVESNQLQPREETVDSRSILLGQIAVNCKNVSQACQAFNSLVEINPDYAHQLVDKLGHSITAKTVEAKKKRYQMLLKEFLSSDHCLNFFSSDQLRQYWSEGFKTRPVLSQLLKENDRQVQFLLDMSPIALNEEGLTSSALSELSAIKLQRKEFRWWVEAISSSFFPHFRALLSVVKLPKFDIHQTEFQEIVKSFDLELYFGYLDAIISAGKITEADYQQALGKLKRLYQDLENNKRSSYQFNQLKLDLLINKLTQTDPQLSEDYWQKTLNLIKQAKKRSGKITPLRLSNLLDGFSALINQDTSKIKELALAFDESDAYSPGEIYRIYGLLLVHILLSSPDRKVSDLFELFFQLVDIDKKKFIKSIVTFGNYFSKKELDLIYSQTQLVEFIIQTVINHYPSLKNYLGQMVCKHNHEFSTAALADLRKELGPALDSFGYDWQQAPVVNCYLPELLNKDTEGVKKGLSLIQTLKNTCDQAELEVEADSDLESFKEEFWIKNQVKLITILQVCPVIKDDLTEFINNNCSTYSELGDTLAHLKIVANYTHSSEATLRFLAAIDWVDQSKLIRLLQRDFNLNNSIKAEDIEYINSFLKQIDGFFGLEFSDDPRFFEVFDTDKFCKLIKQQSKAEAKQLIKNDQLYSLPLIFLAYIFTQFSQILSDEEINIFLTKLIQIGSHKTSDLTPELEDLMYNKIDWHRFTLQIISHLVPLKKESRQLLHDFFMAESEYNGQDEISYLEVMSNAYKKNLIGLLKYFNLADQDPILSRLTRSEQFQLASTSGIRIFARHEPETICNNIFSYHGENLEGNLDGRKAIVFFKSLSDYNGALNKRGLEADLIKDLAEKDPSLDVIMIDSTWQNFHRHLGRQRRKRHTDSRPYSDPQPWIHTLVLNQHGSPDDIEVNPMTSAKTHLSLSDLSQWDKDPSLDFTEEADIILVSCSTAFIDETYPKSIADSLADQLKNRRVTGPTTKTNILMWDVNTDSKGEIHLNPIYRQDRRRTVVSSN